MLKKILNFLFLLFFPSFLFGQSISGKVESVTGEKIAHAQIILKDSINATQIKEFALAVNGVYQLQIRKKYVSLVVEVSTMGYKKEVFVIDTLKSQTYTHDFMLEPATSDLQEVIVSASKKYEQNGDTTSFNVDAYRDGSERKIEDIIKKLPGVEVNENTGAIKYKGKAIETVKLDGDDLFDSNYAVGTRNINVDMVEQVQAIENYNDNPLLKGVESGDKVALNLVLKETKAEYSGTVEIAGGLFLPKNTTPATLVNATVLGISTKYKSFATLSYNNVGTNNTPYNYTEHTEDIDASQNPDMYARKYIPDTYFSTSVGTQRSNFNNTLFSGYNATFKVNNRFRVKINVFYLHDKITSEQYAENNYSFNNENFVTSDAVSIRKTPTRYVGKIDAKYNLSKKSLLEYNACYDSEKIQTFTDILQNNSINYNNVLQSSAYLFKNKLTYTHRVSKKAALQVIGYYVAHNTPQNYNFLPAVYQSNSFVSNQQASEFKKDYFDVNATLLGSKNKDKYDIFCGLIAYKSLFTSSLWGNTTTEAVSFSDYTNYLQYYRNTIYSGGNYNWIKKRLKINASFRMTYLEQTLQDNAQIKRQTSQNFMLSPSLSATYKLNDISQILCNASYKPTPFSEDYFITKPVYLSTRNVKSNEISLQIQQTTILNVGYAIKNTSRSLRMNVIGIYFFNKGNYYDKFLIQQNNTNMVSFFLPEANTLKGINFMIEKYVHGLESTFRLTTNYNIMDYRNVVGIDVLRQNRMNSLNSELFFKTAFDIIINFENITKHFWSVSKTEGGEAFTNQSLTNKFKIIIKPNDKLFLMLNHDYFLPSIQNKTPQISFIDLQGRYKTKKINWSVMINNIANVRTFDQINVNDYSSYIYQTNLLPRHFLVNCLLSF
jgi:hypothetical protein